MKPNAIKSKVASSMIGEIDARELAVRLIERGCKVKRPAGLSASAAWAQFEAGVEGGKIPEFILRDFEAMSLIAIAYFRECIEGMQVKN